MLAALALTLWLMLGPGAAAGSGVAPVVPGQVLVAVEPTALAMGRPLSLNASPAPGVFVVAVPVGQEAAWAQRLAGQPGVRWAEPNYLVQALGQPDDPLWPQQWWHAAIGTAAAWEIARGDPAAVVAVADTGVDLDHPDLGRLWANPGEIADNGLDDDGNGKIDDIHGWHWFVAGDGSLHEDADIQIPTENDPVPTTTAFHGMHVAGIIGAAADNGRGVAGVARGPQIMPLRVLDQFGLGSMAQVAAAVRYAADNGATVINLSLGGSMNSQVLAEAVAAATAGGVSIVAATGNAAGPVYFPAALPQVMAVGGVAADDSLYPRSNFGPETDLAAPAVDILSTWASSKRGGYHTLTGTSMAAPQAAAALTLLAGLRPRATVEELRGWLYTSALDLGQPGRDDLFGWGRLRLDEAVQAAASGLSLSLRADAPSAAPGEMVGLAAEIRDEAGELAGGGLPITLAWPGETGLALTDGGLAQAEALLPPGLQAGEIITFTAAWNGQTAVATVRIDPPSSPTPTPSTTPSPSPTATPSPTFTASPSPTPRFLFYLPLLSVSTPFREGA
ncbi:MAG: S8 family serine peptidase [Caldilineales bacterium]|nr:S8 family serine peptidase [Caldilineales bacterium]MCW5858284.1 S8 family serine peptidase [Caldilineales bacterium]